MTFHPPVRSNADPRRNGTSRSRPEPFPVCNECEGDGRYGPIDPCPGCHGTGYWIKVPAR